MGLKGAAHFIEHMCFKGTKQVPLAKDIYKEYDNIGASFNASTEKEYTEYHVRTQDQYTAHCMQLLSDMVLNSVFKKQEFIKEEHVVIEENIRNADDTIDILFEISQKILYKGSSYEYSIDTLDYHKTKFKYEKVLELYHQYYQPSNMILSVASNLSFETILKMVKNTYFLRKQQKLICSTSYPIYTIPVQSEIQYDISEKPNRNAIQIVISFRTCSAHNNDKHSLRLLQHILSETSSSRMYILLREDNGLTYTSDIYTTYYEHSGDFTIFAELDNTKLIHNGKKRGVLPLVIGMLNDIIKNGITTSEIRDINTNFISKNVFKMEHNSWQASYNGVELLSKKIDEQIVPYKDQYNMYYKNIGKSDIERVIKTYLKKSNMNVCVIGTDLPSLTIIKRECNKFIG
jgi:predicted Zn-dependent peptidase